MGMKPESGDTRGALPRFRLRQAYGATGSEADGEQRTIVLQT